MLVWIAVAAFSLISLSSVVSEYPEDSSAYGNITRSALPPLAPSNTDYALAPELEDLYKKLELLRHNNNNKQYTQGKGLNTPNDVVEHPKLVETFARLARMQAGKWLEKRDVTEDKLVLELAIFSDQSFYDYARSRYPNESNEKLSVLIHDIILSVVSSVQLYFDNPTFGLNLDIRVVDMIQIDPAYLVPQQNIRLYLDRFCEFQRPLKDNTSRSWDHALLLTGLDLYSAGTNGNPELGSSGMAYLSGMCSEQASCTIAEARSLGSTALIIAHELAHNLGADHDGGRQNSNCDMEKYIMGPKLGPGATDWSECTGRQINEFLRTLERFNLGQCLHDTQSSEDSYLDIKQLGLPGKRFSGDDQCKFLYGNEWSYYQDAIGPRQKNDPCEAIWCRLGLHLRSPNAAAFQGTSCADGLICYSGKCTPEKSAYDMIQLSSTGRVSQAPTKPKITRMIQRRRYGSEIFFPETQSTLCDFFKAFGLGMRGC